MTQTLSPLAAKLLDVLQTHACARSKACTDAELAVVLQCPEREVIDLAGELLAADWAVVAETGTRPGRWLVTREDQIAEAEHYDRVLKSRAIACFRRRKTFRRALDATATRLRTPGHQPFLPGLAVIDDGLPGDPAALVCEGSAAP